MGGCKSKNAKSGAGADLDKSRAFSSSCRSNSDRTKSRFGDKSPTGGCCCCKKKKKKRGAGNGSTGSFITPIIPPNQNKETLTRKQQPNGIVMEGGGGVGGGLNATAGRSAERLFTSETCENEEEYVRSGSMHVSAYEPTPVTATATAGATAPANEGEVFENAVAASVCNPLQMTQILNTETNVSKRKDESQGGTMDDVDPNIDDVVFEPLEKEEFPEIERPPRPSENDDGPKASQRKTSKEPAKDKQRQLATGGSKKEKKPLVASTRAPPTHKTQPSITIASKEKVDKEEKVVGPRKMKTKVFEA